MNWQDVPCRLWDKLRTPFGYGIVWAPSGVVGVRGNNRLVHRMTWEKEHGPIPEGLMVLHRCDNPPCYELAHLFLGTATENVADRDAKGRQAKGERAGLAKLTPTQVLEIRHLYAHGLTQEGLAFIYHVSHQAIERIVRGETWAHVGGPRTFRFGR
jgi:hypothetical protein